MGNCAQEDSTLQPGSLNPDMSPRKATLIPSQPSKDKAVLLLSKFHVCL